MYNAEDAVARVDSYIVSVTGAGPFVGDRRLVRIESVGRSAATASLVGEAPGSSGDGQPATTGDAEAGGGDGSVQSRPSRRRRGRRGGRRRSRAKASNDSGSDGE
jgi:hypothetical protein